MAGVNLVIILGRVGKDPEIRSIKSGDSVASFSIATSETWKDKQTSEKKEKTEWHKVVAWRQLADIVGKYVSKGDQIYIEGKLQTRSYEQDGVKKYATEILANKIQLLGGKKQEQRQEPRQEFAPPPTSSADDDIPF